MRGLFFAFVLGAAPRTPCGLRHVGGLGWPAEEATGQAPVTFCRAAPFYKEDDSRDAEPGDCRLGGDNDTSMVEYLMVAHIECVRNERRLTFVPQMEKLERTCGMETLQRSANTGWLRKAFSRPELVYQPYVTSLPLFYISRGGKREACFSAFLNNFSPNTHRIQAVILRGDLQKQLSKLVDEPSVVIESRQLFPSDENGTATWTKKWGCLFAHLHAIRAAYERNHTAAIILEDDALPLYPSWTSTLEEFLLTLPPAWQAVQLQWSSNFSMDIDIKRSKGLVYQRGSGWGTTAYAIHRRGAEHLLSQLYNESSGKFRVARLAQCRRITADDCLLGFTSSWMPSVGSWQPMKHTYKATPPLFLHDSVNSQLHKRNYCQDLELSIEAASQDSRPRPAEARATDGVLLFIALGSSKSLASRSTLKANLKRANDSDVFLAFADGTNTSEEASALKLQKLRHYWQSFGPAWSKKYAFVWAVNEDVKLGFAPHEMVAEANSSGALAVGPTLVDQFMSREQLSSQGRKRRKRRKPTRKPTTLLDELLKVLYNKTPSKFNLNSSEVLYNQSPSKFDPKSSRVLYSRIPGKFDPKSSRVLYNRIPSELDSKSSKVLQSQTPGKLDSKSFKAPLKLDSKSSPVKQGFRFTNYISALAPMMTPAAWWRIFNESEQNDSFEGIDQMWCDSLQRSDLWQSHDDGATACAILDGLVAAHITDDEVHSGHNKVELLAAANRPKDEARPAD